MTIDILISPNGTILAVYHDVLRGLDRPMTVRRESRVEFDNDSQSWKAWDVDTGELIAEAERYDDCVAQEHGPVFEKMKRRYEAKQKDQYDSDRALE